MSLGLQDERKISTQGLSKIYCTINILTIFSIYIFIVPVFQLQYIDCRPSIRQYIYFWFPFHPIDISIIGHGHITTGYRENMVDPAIRWSKEGLFFFFFFFFVIKSMDIS